MKTLLFFAALTTSTLAAAGPIYLNGNDGQFGTITTAGVFTSIGYSLYPTGAPIGFGDIAVSPSGAVYGEDYFVGNSLYSIDPLTGAATLVGPSGTPLWGMAFNNSGTLYAADNTGLYTINTATGAATFIGANGVELSGDIEFAGGDLYETAVDGLYGVNPATGAAWEITPAGVAFPGDMYGLAYYDGTLYGFTGDNNIWTVNTTLGTATLIGAYTGNPFTGSTFGASTSPTPSPASALTFCSLAAAAIRRRKKA